MPPWRSTTLTMITCGGFDTGFGFLSVSFYIIVGSVFYIFFMSEPLLVVAIASRQVWRERPSILLAIVAAMGVIELTVGREDYGGYDGEPGRLGDFWQAARPQDPQVC